MDFTFDLPPVDPGLVGPTGIPRARRSDPVTSHEAAAAHPESRQIDRERAYAALCDARDGLTDFELGAVIGRQQTSAGKRRKELCDEYPPRARAMVNADGTKRRRPAPSGSPAIVWEAVRKEQ